MGIATTCYMTVRRFRDTLEFMDHCHSLGAGGVQTALTAQTPEYLRQVKERAAKYGMWIEVMGGLPRSDNDESFQRTAASAKEVGAICIRSACLGGRRYETFAAMEDWKKFVANSKAAIARGVAMAEKAKMPWALENHKDWTVDEFLEILKQYSSPYLGVCLDTGNNISLLDDAMDVVERLAPYAISTHIKDMGLDEYADGFLLSEVPLGDGYLDIAQIIRIIQRARPQTRMTLEMITRDPLKIPVLTDKYWATFTDRDGARLARALRTARTAKNKKPLPMLTTLAAKAQAEAEEENVKKCLTYARERLSL
jgi:sugar phosphate isomerase/epimerase